MKSLVSAFFCISFLSIGCQSTPRETPPSASPLKVLPPEVLLSPVKPDEVLISQQIALIENSFVKKHCESVLEHESRLSRIVNGDSALPTSTRIALDYCRAKQKPKDPMALSKALETLETAKKELTPNWNALTLESLTGELHRLSGRKDLLLESQKRLKKLARWHEDLSVQIDAEIFSSAKGTESWTANQREHFQRILNSWSQSKASFQILSEIDLLSAELSATSDRGPIQDFRNAVLLEIENQFALETSGILRKIEEGKVGEARSLADTAKRSFPQASFQNRIEALFPQDKPTLSASPDPSQNTNTLPNLPPSSLGNSADPDLAFDSARRSLNEGQPEKAIEQIDQVPKNLLNEKLNRLRKEAIESHVRKTRTQVRNLFNRANASKNATEKKQLLEECEALLVQLLKRYPDAPGRQGIERNIRNLQMEMKEPLK